MVAGHRLRVLAGGGEAYPEMLAAIDAATREIDLETYIWSSDKTGRRFAAALADKARAGVAVRCIVDGAGSYGFEAAIWEPLLEAGVQLSVFHPVGPWRARWGWAVRDHRKLLLVDGRVAFTGGLNLGDEYAPREPPWHGKGWHDVHLRIEGPAVAELQRLFNATFRYVEPRTASFLVPEPRDLGGDASAQALAVGRRKDRTLIQRHYLFAVHMARKSILIESAYFIPNRSWRRALRRAAEHGVDVRVLVPRESDVPGIRWASRFTWGALLRAGVRIYELLPAMLHAKTILIDGAWAAVGSYNLDQRSLRYNWEVAVAMVDPEACAALQAAFEADCAQSLPVDAASWEERSLWTRLREQFFYFFRLWL
jgi:cardiolipin synthase